MKLSLWTVYDRPLDMPDAIVARRFDIGNEESSAVRLALVAPDLAIIRHHLAMAGLTCIGRSSDDDPAIVEVWL